MVDQMVDPLNEALADCFPGRAFNGRPLRVIAEPGQLLCQSAVTLVTSIITKKRAHPHTNAAKTCNGNAANGSARNDSAKEGFAYVLNECTSMFYWRRITGTSQQSTGTFQLYMQINYLTSQILIMLSPVYKIIINYKRYLNVKLYSIKIYANFSISGKF